MNQKQLIILLVSAVVSMTFIILIAGGLYKYNPSVLGLGPDTASVPLLWDTLEIRQETVVSPKELEKLRAGIERYESLYQSEKRKAELAYKLNDTVTDKQKMIRDLLDTIGSREKTISRLNKKSQRLMDSLSMVHDTLDLFRNESSIYNQLVDEQRRMLDQQMDSLYMANFKAFAGLYNNADPVEVAKILSQIDNTDAARILKFMQKKKAGKVIENLPASKAAAILLLGYD